MRIKLPTKALKTTLACLIIMTVLIGCSDSVVIKATTGNATQQTPSITTNTINTTNSNNNITALPTSILQTDPPATNSIAEISTATPEVVATKDIATNTPDTTAPVPTDVWWKPTPDQPIHWHWQLSDKFIYPRDVLPNVEVYDIDGEQTSADTVAKLHTLGPNVKVICYFDAGVYETYRSDASSFPKSVIGNADTGWDGSYWLDIRQTNVLLPIIKNRMQTWCKDKGFDAIEPDETEVWSNNSGFPITKEQNNYYNEQIAAMAHSLGLSVALKGNTSEAPELWSYFDFTINEQCWEYNECDQIKSSFIDHGKAAFNIEYNVNPNCATANSWHMNSARRDLDLVGPTNSDYQYTPCVPDSQNVW